MEKLAQKLKVKDTWFSKLVPDGLWGSPTPDLVGFRILEGMIAINAADSFHPAA